MNIICLYAIYIHTSRRSNDFSLVAEIVQAMKTATMALLWGMALLVWGGGWPTIAGAKEVGYHQPTCEEVRLQCAFAPSCSMALHTYFNKCDKMLQDDSTKCPQSCLYALVALTSTAAGKQMMDVSVTIAHQ